MGQYFEFVKNDTITVEGHILHRIRCTRDCKWAKKGEFGGYIEEFENLFGDAWVCGDARVFGNAQVYGNARVYGDAWVSGNARVFGKARVFGNAQVYGDAQVCGNVWVYGDAQVYGNAQVSGDAQVRGDARIDCIKAHCGFDVFGSYGRHTHAYITAENKIEITCGCFRGSIEEFEAKVRKTHGDNQYAHEYLAIIYLIKIKFGLV